MNDELRERIEALDRDLGGLTGTPTNAMLWRLLRIVHELALEVGRLEETVEARAGSPF